MTLSHLRKLSLYNLGFAVICTLALFTNSYLWRHGMESYVDEHGIILMTPPAGLLFSSMLAFLLILMLTYKGISSRSTEHIKLPLGMSLIVFLSVAIPVGSERYERYAQAEHEHVNNCVAVALEAGKPLSDGRYESTLRDCLSR